MLSQYVRETEPRAELDAAMIPRALCHVGSSGRGEETFYTPFGSAIKSRSGCLLPKTGY